MGRFVFGDIPRLDELVEKASAGIGRDIESLRVPRLAGVVLGGGYGRGEGGAKKNADGEFVLSNDLDFFAVTEPGEGDEATRPIAGALRPVSEKWTASLGVDVDFAVKTPWRLKHDEERIMVQELLRGYFDVAGDKGEKMFAGIAKRDAGAIPWMEAARLLMNRGMGLLFAKESGRSRDFAIRNINKCILGAGDAFLVSRGKYSWRATERADSCEALGGCRLYRKAVEWKFRPGEEPVCDWEAAREEWLGAKAEVFASIDGISSRRTLRSAARWLVRRRTLGVLATLGMEPVVRILERIAQCVEKRSAVPADLLRDWEIFN